VLNNVKIKNIFFCKKLGRFVYNFNEIIFSDRSIHLPQGTLRSQR